MEPMAGGLGQGDEQRNAVAFHTPGAAPYGSQGACVDFPPFEKTLDSSKSICDIFLRMRRYSTPQAAKDLGLSLASLHRYIVAGKVPTPNVFKPRTLKVLPWTRADIEKVRKILPKIANGRKTRYKKKGSKKTK
jgi:hypothetical protein